MCIRDREQADTSREVSAINLPSTSSTGAEQRTEEASYSSTGESNLEANASPEEANASPEEANASSEEANASSEEASASPEEASRSKPVVSESAENQSDESSSSPPSSSSSSSPSSRSSSSNTYTESINEAGNAELESESVDAVTVPRLPVSIPRSCLTEDQCTSVMEKNQKLEEKTETRTETETSSTSGEVRNCFSLRNTIFEFLNFEFDDEPETSSATENVLESSSAQVGDEDAENAVNSCEPSTASPGMSIASNEQCTTVTQNFQVLNINPEFDDGDGQGSTQQAQADDTSENPTSDRSTSTTSVSSRDSDGFNFEPFS